MEEIDQNRGRGGIPRGIHNLFLNLKVSVKLETHPRRILAQLLERKPKLRTGCPLLALG